MRPPRVKPRLWIVYGPVRTTRPRFDLVVAPNRTEAILRFARLCGVESDILADALYRDYVARRATHRDIARCEAQHQFIWTMRRNAWCTAQARAEARLPYILHPLNPRPTVH